MRLSLHRPALATLLALASAAALFVHTGASAETYWLDGYEVEVTLRPSRDSFVLGEPVSVVLEFENRSGQTLELLLSGEEGRRWPDDFEMTVTGPDGATLPRPADADRDNSYTNTFVRAAGGDLAAHKAGVVLTLTDWARFERPGLYTVTLRRGVRAGPYNGRRYRIMPGTTKPAVELRAQTRVRITRGGEERVGGLIGELGAKMLECDPPHAVESATRLAALEDPRAVGPLAEAVAKCKNPSVKYTALQGLGKFRTDAALDALRAAAADPDEDFRTVVANVIAGNKHPKASALLMSMRDDPYYGVRLMVLNALKAKDTEAARRVIWEMTNDKHPMVREEALRFLQQHPAPRRR